MTSSYLKLKDDKTEVIIVGSKAQLGKSNINTIDVYNSNIAVKVKNSVKNIGVYIDSELTMKHHVNHISSVAWCHLRNFFRIRRYLATSASSPLYMPLLPLALVSTTVCSSIAPAP